MTLATLLIMAAAAAGIVLFALYPLVHPAGRVWWPGALHGAAGAAGFGWLALALDGAPPRGVSTGAGSFGLIAAVLLGLGLLLGAAAFVARWRRRRPAMLLLGVHATLAVAGLVMLVAYVSAPA